MAKYQYLQKTQLPIAECYRCHCPIYIGDMYYGNVRRIRNEEIKTSMTLAFEAGQKAGGKRNAVVKEYEDEGVMFVLMVKDGKTYEASMPIPKWAEVGKLEFRTPTTEDLSGKE